MHAIRVGRAQRAYPCKVDYGGSVSVGLTAMLGVGQPGYHFRRGRQQVRQVGHRAPDSQPQGGGGFSEIGYHA